MAKVCIPKELIDKVKTTLLATGDNSLARLKAFQELYGGDLKQAQELNLLYERGKLLKRQKDIVNKFIEKVTGLSELAKKELQDKIDVEIARKTDILNKEELLSIVKNAVDKKFKIEIKPEDAANIAKIKAKTNELNQIAKDTPWESPERIAAARNELIMSKYIENIVNPTSNMGLVQSLNKILLTDSFARLNNQKSYLGKAGEVGSMLGELAFSPVYKSLKAAVDASFALRQGFKVLTKTPQAWWKANKEAFNVLLSSKKNSEMLYDEFRARLMSSELYNIALDAGVALNKVEDFFPVPIGEKIPVLGALFKNSDSAFSTFSQSARMSLFEDMYRNQVKILGKAPEKEVVEGLAMLANSITGRGSYGRFENIGNIANKVLFSGRYVKSAIDTFTLPFDSSLPDAVRKEAVKSSIGAISGALALMTTASAFTDVGFDPRSSKFGKVRIPNTDRWIDVTAGLGSYITLATRTGLGLTTDVFGMTETKPFVNSKGKETNLNTNKFGSKNIASVIGDWASNKLAPAPSAVLQILKGKDYSGEKPTLGGTVTNLVAPISSENAIESAMTSDDAAALQVIGTVFDALGWSQTDYGKFK